MVRTRRQGLREEAPHGPAPGPIVEIAEHDRDAMMALGNLGKLLRLAAALGKPEAKVNGRKVDRAEGGFDVAFDGASLLELPIRKIVELHMSHRPAADDRMTVVSVLGHD